MARYAALAASSWDCMRVFRDGVAFALPFLPPRLAPSNTVIMSFACLRYRSRALRRVCFSVLLADRFSVQRVNSPGCCLGTRASALLSSAKSALVPIASASRRCIASIRATLSVVFSSPMRAMGTGSQARDTPQILVPPPEPRAHHAVYRSTNHACSASRGDVVANRAVATVAGELVSLPSPGWASPVLMRSTAVVCTCSHRSRLLGTRTRATGNMPLFRAALKNKSRSRLTDSGVSWVVRVVPATVRCCCSMAMAAKAADRLRGAEPPLVP